MQTVLKYRREAPLAKIKWIAKLFNQDYTSGWIIRSLAQHPLLRKMLTNQYGPESELFIAHCIDMSILRLKEEKYIPASGNDWMEEKWCVEFVKYIKFGTVHVQFNRSSIFSVWVQPLVGQPRTLGHAGPLTLFHVLKQAEELCESLKFIPGNTEDRPKNPGQLLGLVGTT